MRRRGFTLIELLVVIAIIALLVGILLPALSRSRQLGRATSCLSNMRVMAQATHMYADSNDGRFPTVGLAHGGSGADEQKAWINTMLSEYGDLRVTRCPSDESPHWTTPVPGTTDQYRRLSYASNFYMTGSLPETEDYLVLTRIRSAATTIYWVELAEKGEFAGADHIHPETWFSNPLPLASEELELTRHLGRANYALVDGHAEPFKFEQTYSIDFAASSFPNIAWVHNRYDPKIGW